MIIFAEKTITDMYIHQSEGWPHFTWDSDKIDSQLAVVNKAAGFLEGRLSAIGFDVQQRYRNDSPPSSNVGQTAHPGTTRTSHYNAYDKGIDD